jgi:hypothetical protein
MIERWDGDEDGGPTATAQADAEATEAALPLRERARLANEREIAAKADYDRRQAEEHRKTYADWLKLRLSEFMGINAEPEGPDVEAEGFTWHIGGSYGSRYDLRVTLGECPACGGDVYSGPLYGVASLGNALADCEAAVAEERVPALHRCPAWEAEVRAKRPATPPQPARFERLGELLAEALEAAGYSLRREL